MAGAKDGDVVRVHYTGRLTSGEEFDSSRERDPLQVTLGAGGLIAGFEAALHGMEAGATKTVEIPAAEAYGPTKDELVFEIDKERLPGSDDLGAGQVVTLSQDDGRSMQVKVADITETKIKLDANHPLAGEDLVFDLEMVEIV